MVKMHKLLSFENNAFTVDICCDPCGLLNINPVSEDLIMVEIAFVQIQNKTDYF